MNGMELSVVTDFIKIDARRNSTYGENIINLHGILYYHVGAKNRTSQRSKWLFLT